MKRFVLSVLLALSLAGNAWWLLRSRVAPPPATNPTTAAVAARAPAGPAFSGASAAGDPARDATAPDRAARDNRVLWRTPQTDADYRALAADLRAAGVPPRLIFTVLRDLYRHQKLAASPLANAPYWQRRTVEMSAEMRALSRKIENEVETLLGPIANPAARLTSVARARRYGDLPDAKIDLIAGIERDYQEIQTDIYSAVGPGAFGPEESAARQKQANLLKAEMRADLAKVLAPAELEAFELRTSDAARQLAYSVRDLSLSAGEFSALYRARQALEVAVASLSSAPVEQFAQRRAAQASYFSAARGVLTDDRFYPFLAANDPDYRSIANLGSQFPQMTSAASYQVWQLKNQLEEARTSLLRSRPSPEAVQRAYADWNAQLESLLGTAAADAFRKTASGRAFNAPVPRPATPIAPASPRG